MSNSLDYLKPFKKFIDWDKLVSLKAERESWWERRSSEKWKIDQYPVVDHVSRNLHSNEVTIEGEVGPSQRENLEVIAKKLIPWKKGPFKLFHLDIDAEWRSDLKWSRLEKAIPSLKDKVVLDIGCNNGYFLFRMAAHSPRLVLGIDPVLPMQAQFDLIQNYVKAENTHFELFGVEHLTLFKEMYDVIFHMGIIYHHRHPIQQLIDIREALKPGGCAVIETIGIPGEDSIALFPEDRYARMGNVWFVPTMNCLINWAKKARFIDIEVIANTDMTHEEQRLTSWCPPPFQSLDASLDPENPELTIEGHPAPRRLMIKVTKKAGQ